jgi:outer membrane cobalamin receptor
MIWRNRFLQCIHWFVFILITNQLGYALAAPEKPNTQNSQHASSDSTIHNLGASVTHFYQWQSLQTLGNHTTLHADKWQGKGISLGQVLASETGIRVLNTGGAGAFQTLSIRGIPGSHVLIYKDGVLLNNSRNDAVNLSSINMNEIQSIHIYKGHAPAHLGGNSAGGVIHLQSYSPVHSTKSQTKLFTQYGSHNTSDMTIALLGSLSASTRWQSTIGMQHSDNDFKYFNNNGTPYNPDDDKYTKRTNSQYTRWSGLHAFDALLASGSLHFSVVS